MTKITLPNPIEKVIFPATTKILSELTISRVVDLPNEKQVKIFIEELPNFIILWEGSEYDAIGQWTDSDVEAKLLTLFV